MDGSQEVAFGALLRRCRLSAGMTQEELARASTLSVRAISDLERGRTASPQRKSVELLTSALTQRQQVAGVRDGARRLLEAAVMARLSPGPGPGPERPVLSHPRPPDDGIPRELPPDVADFTGRSAELREVREALCPPLGPPQRLVLITGHPGAGRTALAVHAAHRCRGAFPDGQVHVDLAPAGRPAPRPDEVVRRVLRSLGAPAGAYDSPEEASARLRAVLARRRVLIVLDDAVGEGQIRCVCPALGGSAVLATGRRRLAALPGARHVEVGAFTTGEALAFLARTVGAERVGRAPREAARVAELCGRLPLALRVAGCRLRARPHWTLGTLAEEVLGEPRTRLRELSAGDLSVRASVAAAFALLDDQTQWALLRLAADGGTVFGLQGAAALLGCGAPRVHRILGDLLDCHLLEVTETEGRTRYRLPALVRLFALEGQRVV
ncbi:NB-ARC domain-containing protein [Streptomyces sp. NPDC049585]|uniref:NB-ARC domain-containing protein n=1 Tax=Streptomyces sp. NPDC049585 TaxID=3155154 RepID=UPI00343F894A